MEWCGLTINRVSYTDASLGSPVGFSVGLISHNVDFTKQLVKVGLDNIQITYDKIIYELLLD